MENQVRLGLFWLSLCLFLLPPPGYSAEFPSKYDSQIQTAVKRYWPDLPEWRWGKSQLYQESRLDPSVCSSAGACGLGQFLSGSWDDTIKALGYPKTVSRHDAAIAIGAYAYYQAKMRHAWGAGGRTVIDRNDLGLCSYNAGLGNCLKAQKACNDARLWWNIAPCMQNITGPQNAKQTTDYVERIHRWEQLMESQR